MPTLPDPQAPLILLAGALPEATEPLLHEAGCRVRRAFSVVAALRLAEERPQPRLLLLADAVGEGHGMDLLTRLREQPATRNLPVLYVGSGDEELALALGASDCLSLPLRPLVLLARVQAQLRLQRLSELTAHGQVQIIGTAV